jgi:hypothetical protein
LLPFFFEKKNIKKRPENSTSMAEIKKESGKCEDKSMAKEYAALKAKYGLPELAELDREFALDSLDCSSFPLRFVLNSMNERIELCLKLIGDLIQPESHIADMHEAEMFSDEEKKYVYILFKRLAYYNKELLMRDFDYSDEAAAALINKFFKDWKVIKADFLRVLGKMKDSWEKEIKSKDDSAGYFG